MNDRLVTIIIPAHNRLLWLMQTLSSLAVQTYQNLEIIIVDDASDPPLQSILNFDDPRIKIIRQDENKGPGLSREAGRLVARGEFINYLDSDDLFSPRKIEKQVNHLISHPEIGMTYCTSTVIADELKEETVIWSNSDQTFSSIFPILLYQRPWATSSCLWRRSVTDKIGTWTALPVGEDIEYESRAGCSGIQISHISDPLCVIRKHNEEDGITNNSPRHQLEETGYKLRVSENILDSRLKGNMEIQPRIGQILFNQAVFLYSQRERYLGSRCLRQARKHSANESIKFALLSGIILISKVPQYDFLLKLLRAARPLLYTVNHG